MLSSTKNTGIHGPKADSVDQSSAVVEHPLPQTFSQVTAHLPEGSCLHTHGIAHPRPSSQNTPAAKTHSHGATTVEPAKKLGMK